jgi:exodeoxyribonuclease VIII
MTFAEYQAINAVNWSSLAHMAVSPLAYQHALCSPREDTDDLRFGRLFHCAALEPDEVPRRYDVWRGGSKIKGEGAVTRWRQFQAAAADRDIEVADPDRYDLALRMRDAVRTHPAASRYVTGQGPTELVVTWTDEKTGIACKARLDKVACGAIFDLKSARDISERAVRRAMLPICYGGLGYAGQLAWYRRGLVASGYEGAHADMPCLLGCVEKSDPHDVAVWSVSPNALYNGELEADASLARLAECRASGKWPGAHEEEEELDFGEWFYDSEDAEKGRDPVWLEEDV